jgi:tetratricopeptide (TPR) repeat protein
MFLTSQMIRSIPWDEPSHLSDLAGLRTVLRQSSISMPRLPLARPTTTSSPVIRPAGLLERASKLLRAGERGQARVICEQVLRADPVNPDAFTLLGAILAEDRRYPEAIAQFRNAIRIAPDCVDAWRNQGIALSDLGLLDEALASFDQVVALRPSLAHGHALRARTLYRLGRFEEALRAHDPILALTGRDAAMTANRAAALLWSGRVTEAMAEFDRAVTLNPEYPAARLNKGLAQLLLGDLANGFRGLEWRWRQPPLAELARNYLQPLWTGQVPLAGKTLLLHAEQGFGDTIQFCRYAALAANGGARVILEVPPALVRLLRTLSGAIKVIATGEEIPDFDLHCPLLSLPIGFGTTLDTIPAKVPYLFADPARVGAWRETTTDVHGVRIGLVWAGGSFASHTDQTAFDRRRSTTLNTLAPLATVSGCDFISLQVGPAATQASSLGAGVLLRDHTAELRDFADTAALIETLDLVIGVDTSVIHLAGALGKPVWLLNRFDTDWRWFLDRDDSPWYPTLRQFRQSSPGDWDGVATRAAQALRSFVAETGARVEEPGSGGLPSRTADKTWG